MGFLVLVGSVAAVELGQVPSSIVLDGDNGGKTDGSAWNSSMLKGKVHILFYVDPDERKLNEPLSQALKKRHFNRKKYASVAMINLADDNSDILIFDKSGKLIYKKFGKLSAKEIKDVLVLIEKNL